MTDNPINDRRQRAREAGYDAPGLVEVLVNVDAAIEVATQVKITEDIIVAAQQAFPVLTGIDEGRTLLSAAFCAAGFEVIE